MYFFWLACALFREDIRNKFNDKIKNIFIAIWCIIPGALIGGYTVYSAVTTWELNYEWYIYYYITKKFIVITFLIVGAII